MSERIVLEDEILVSVPLMDFDSDPPFPYQDFIVVVEPVDTYADWMIDVHLCERDVTERQPQGKIRLNEKKSLFMGVEKARWLATSLLEAIEYTETHACGEGAGPKLGVVADDEVSN